MLYRKIKILSLFFNCVLMIQDIIMQLFIIFVFIQSKFQSEIPQFLICELVNRNGTSQYDQIDSRISYESHLQLNKNIS
ncbi:unnamed protein product [Paramecium pentaurelia]|uniref:Transmembrane protein n=1 Tax=Paramecium pentaurelia TaxID=43138 RepID=A0A8S1V6U7_9CILI|nr:unnamed protein product [Paramecium pentaurelia]